MSLIHYPVSTEKALRMMEAENKLVFMVDPKADKAAIAKHIEGMFETKVTSVNTLRTLSGKKAIVTFSAETPAIDIATKLGLM